jgi:hypothetical protein
MEAGGAARAAASAPGYQRSVRLLRSQRGAASTLSREETAAPAARFWPAASRISSSARAKM